MFNNRIAMWSGPRNLSTAMMRSFSSRTDCTVVDEPFYAAYLFSTGIYHPLREKVINSQSTSSLIVAKECIEGDLQSPIEYQKHMTHHMISKFDRSFIYKLSNAFLIRSPDKVVKSFSLKLKNFSLEEIGLKQQVEIFQMVSDKIGHPPPVIDVDDVCKHPEKVLSALCSSLNITFCKSMLKWPRGAHKNDGIWGDYWYRSVNKTTGFKFPKKPVKLSFNEEELKLIDKSLPYYEILNKHKLAF